MDELEYFKQCMTKSLEIWINQGLVYIKDEPDVIKLLHGLKDDKLFEKLISVAYISTLEYKKAKDELIHKSAQRRKE